MGSGDEQGGGTRNWLVQAWHAALSAFRPGGAAQDAAPALEGEATASQGDAPQEQLASISHLPVRVPDVYRLSSGEDARDVARAIVEHARQKAAEEGRERVADDIGRAWRELYPHYREGVDHQKVADAGSENAQTHMDAVGMKPDPEMKAARHARDARRARNYGDAGQGFLSLVTSSDEKSGRER